MAANTPNLSETTSQSKFTKKKSKALERIVASHSVPWNKPNLSEIQDTGSSCPVLRNVPTIKPGLEQVQTLTECQQLLQKLADEVNNINQVKCERKKAAPKGGATEQCSLEASRSLILQWARELEQNMTKREAKPTDKKMRERDVPGTKETTELEKHNDRLQQWAVELWNIKEAHGVSDEELKKLLYPTESKKSRMAAILPLLEFVAWSLLSEEPEEAVSRLWLPTKQKAWRTGTGNPKYIPNSVWQWIQSASVSVRLDVSTSHSWLLVSSDRLQVQEAAVRSSALSNNSQQSAGWPCVLGDTIITAGRHYWEVEVSPTGSWRIGVMSESASRKQKSTMSPTSGYWTLWKGASLWACTEEPTKLKKAAMPQLIGVYVDVGEGQVSFYDVDRRVHIYTFSDTFQHNLIPLFVCLDGDTVLKIIQS